LISVCVC